MIGQTERYEKIINKLRNEGFRITPQRLSIIKVLISDTSHPSIERVYNKVKTDFPTTSLATIYKTVAMLKDMGELMEISLGDGSNRVDGFTPDPHPHLICSQCKKIIDADVEEVNAVNLALTQTYGYKITGHRLDFFGLCPECQKNSKN